MPCPPAANGHIPARQERPGRECAAAANYLSIQLSSEGLSRNWLDIPLFGGDLHQRIEVRKAVIDDAGLFQALKPLFHAVGEDRSHTQHLGTGLAQGVHHLDAGTAGRDQVFDHDDLLPLLQFAFDPVAAAMVFQTAAHITHRQVEDRRRDGRMGDAGGRSAHQHLGTGEFGADDPGKPGLDRSAHDRCRQRQSVVAIDRALDTAGPGKRRLGAQEYRADREQVFRN